MAIRASKGTQTAGRPGSGRRGRAEPAPRGRRAKKASRAAKSGRRYTRSRRRDNPRGVPPSVAAHPLLILLGWGASAVAGLWMLLAHGAGAVVREIDRNARSLEPAHRRDGLGLAAIGAAIVVAGTALWPTDNAASRLMTTVVRGAFGSLTWTLPILLALLGWRFLRHPDRNAETSRMIIGWLALITGALGLVHIANGTPHPSAGARAMRDAGGLIGFAASAPLVTILTPWLAALLLALVAGFGVLVITGTPVRAVPRRLARLLGRPDPAAGTDTGAGGKTGYPERPGAGSLARFGRRQQAIEAGEHERPYDSPLLAERGTRIRPAPAGGADGRVAGRGGTAADGDDGLLDTLGFGPRAGQIADGLDVGMPAAASARPPAPGRPPLGGMRTATACCASPSSSPWPGPPTPATPCRPRRCCGPGPRRRPGPGPMTPWWRRWPACWNSSRSMPRSPGSPGGRRSPGMRSSSARRSRWSGSPRCRGTSPTR